MQRKMISWINDLCTFRPILCIYSCNYVSSFLLPPWYFRYFGTCGSVDALGVDITPIRKIGGIGGDLQGEVPIDSDVDEHGIDPDYNVPYSYYVRHSFWRYLMAFNEYRYIYCVLI